MQCLKMKEMNKCTRELCDMIIEPRISFRLQISLYNLLAITTGLAVALILLQRNVWITKDVRNQGPDLCKGRWIFIHNVSQAYNHAFLQDCSSFKKDRDLCMYMENDGMGGVFNYTISLGGPPLAKPSWYNTWQFSLELYFHRRLLNHPCVTTQEHLADVFYVPYYGGMDLSRTFSHRLPKEKLYVELVEWLNGRESWKRRNGRDHFITLGRISRDFRRPGGVLAWGNKMLLEVPFKNMVKLTIERNASKTTYDEADIEFAIPYPTYFHGSSDAQIRNLLVWLRQSSQRTSLVSLAGGGRRGSQNLRHILLQQCEKDIRCTLLVCEGHEASPGLAEQIATTYSLQKLTGRTLHISCNNPLVLLSALHQSQFCLQPPGDSPTRRSFFDSMLAGCIPVIFSKQSAWWQYLNHLPEDGSSYSIHIPFLLSGVTKTCEGSKEDWDFLCEEVKENLLENRNILQDRRLLFRNRATQRHQASTQNVINILSKVRKERIDAMRAKIEELVPRILYAHVNSKDTVPAAFRASQGTSVSTPDAFDISLDAVISKIRSRFPIPLGFQ